jgi:hypothetical protein
MGIKKNLFTICLNGNLIYDFNAKMPFATSITRFKKIIYWFFDGFLIFDDESFVL